MDEEKELERYVKIGLLSKNKKGYIYPKWLLSYSKDRRLMMNIQKSLALQQEEFNKKIVELQEEIVRNQQRLDRPHNRELKYYLGWHDCSAQTISEMNKIFGEKVGEVKIKQIIKKEAGDNLI